jgi:hypothetical protein
MPAAFTLGRGRAGRVLFYVRALSIDLGGGIKYKVSPRLNPRCFASSFKTTSAFKRKDAPLKFVLTRLVAVLFISQGLDGSAQTLTRSAAAAVKALRNNGVLLMAQAQAALVRPPRQSILRPF